VPFWLNVMEDLLRGGAWGEPPAQKSPTGEAAAPGEPLPTAIWEVVAAAFPDVGLDPARLPCDDVQLGSPGTTLRSRDLARVCDLFLFSWSCHEVVCSISRWGE
jgi:hypothetical protein